VPLMRDLKVNGWVQHLDSLPCGFDLIGEGVKRG
jgi:hypothetical protein